MRYVAGFLFDPSRTQVLLIQKIRPAWQAGKLNGIGGHIEPGETPMEAMVREFKEETDLLITNWRERVVLTGEGYVVHFFSAVGDLVYAKTMTDEPIWVVPVDAIASRLTIPNLRWLVPLAADDQLGGPIKIVEWAA